VTDPPGNLIDTDRYSDILRPRLMSPGERAISLTNFGRSEQAADIDHPPNCDGFGRLHLFELEAFDDWPSNPLPIRPALQALDLPMDTSLPAQVFQNSGCNWRCWYCYVPFDDLTTRRGEFVPVARMVDCTLETHAGKQMVDLSGGQPDLVPEWPVWFLEELAKRSADQVYVWSDDNLSTDYLWKFLSASEIDLLSDNTRYGRACCIKGFDPESFSFNTRAHAELFDRQFQLLRRLREDSRIDYYVYLTITTPNTTDLAAKMARLVDRLQAIGEYVPLRCVPLKILEWGPMAARMTPATTAALQNQHAAVDAWLTEVHRRFPGTLASVNVEDVPR
jgi:uncharacterized Fe-S cluster-containing radical SAM superfamily protein